MASLHAAIITLLLFVLSAAGAGAARTGGLVGASTPAGGRGALPAEAADAAARDRAGASPLHAPAVEPRPGGPASVAGWASWWTAWPRPRPAQHWALLVAGSSGWGNYRHQADVAHSYHTLLRKGFERERIIVMLYDDVAYDDNNPSPGKLFNSPSGPDVYAGLRVDYRGEDVSAQTFLAVLEGRDETLRGVGSGRVVASGHKDHLFVYYSDHGGPGLLGMPGGGEYLYADWLLHALERKFAARGIKQVVMYIEACFAGSMLDGLLDGSRLPVYAVTASNTHESSYATFCPSLGPQGGAQGGSTAPRASGVPNDTCLGDQFSVAFMRDDDAKDVRRESLKRQFTIVRDEVAPDPDAAADERTPGSHVSRYGRLSIGREHVGDFVAGRPRWRPWVALARPFAWLSSALVLGGHLGGPPAAPTAAVGPTVLQAAADLMPLAARVAKHPPGAAATFPAVVELQAALSARDRVESRLRAAIAAALRAHPAAGAFIALGGLGGGGPAPGSGAGGPTNAADHDGGAGDELLERHVDALMTALPPAGQPVVFDWNCYRAMLAAHATHCGFLPDTHLSLARGLANLCNAGVPPAALAAGAAGACPTEPAPVSSAQDAPSES